jgi:hypothetical protein
MGLGEEWAAAILIGHKTIAGMPLPPYGQIQNHDSPPVEYRFQAPWACMVANGRAELPASGFSVYQGSVAYGGDAPAEGSTPDATQPVRRPAAHQYLINRVQLAADHLIQFGHLTDTVPQRRREELKLRGSVNIDSFPAHASI